MKESEQSLDIAENASDKVSNGVEENFVKNEKDQTEADVKARKENDDVYFEKKQKEISSLESQAPQETGEIQNIAENRNVKSTSFKNWGFTDPYRNLEIKVRKIDQWRTKSYYYKEINKENFQVHVDEYVEEKFDEKSKIIPKFLRRIFFNAKKAKIEKHIELLTAAKTRIYDLIKSLKDLDDPKVDKSNKENLSEIVGRINEGMNFCKNVFLSLKKLDLNVKTSFELNDFRVNIKSFSKEIDELNNLKKDVDLNIFDSRSIGKLIKKYFKEKDRPIETLVFVPLDTMPGFKSSSSVPELSKEHQLNLEFFNLNINKENFQVHVDEYVEEKRIKQLKDSDLQIQVEEYAEKKRSKQKKGSNQLQDSAKSSRRFSFDANHEKLVKLNEFREIAEFNFIEIEKLLLKLVEEGENKEIIKSLKDRRKIVVDFIQKVYVSFKEAAEQEQKKVLGHIIEPSLSKKLFLSECDTDPHEWGCGYCSSVQLYGADQLNPPEPQVMMESPAKEVDLSVLSNTDRSVPSLPETTGNDQEKSKVSSSSNQRIGSSVEGVSAKGRKNSSNSRGSMKL